MELQNYKDRLESIIRTSVGYNTKDICILFAIKSQIDILFKVDEDMANLMIEHGRTINIDKETAHQLWMETAWCKVLRAQIDQLKLLKEEIENV